MLADSPLVIAGLDPAIHPLRENCYSKKMDARVKPAHDGLLVCAACYYVNG
jgi:hypothetical protein